MYRYRWKDFYSVNDRSQMLARKWFEQFLRFQIDNIYQEIQSQRPHRQNLYIGKKQPQA